MLKRKNGGEGNENPEFGSNTFAQPAATLFFQSAVCKKIANLYPRNFYLPGKANNQDLTKTICSKIIEILLEACFGPLEALTKIQKEALMAGLPGLTIDTSGKVTVNTNKNSRNTCKLSAMAVARAFGTMAFFANSSGQGIKIDFDGKCDAEVRLAAGGKKLVLDLDKNSKNKWKTEYFDQVSERAKKIAIWFL